MNVRRNLSFASRLLQKRAWWKRLLRMSEAKHFERELADRIEQTAELVGLEGLLDRLPNQISGGQQQRVALGRAIMRQPAVFLLDEPLSHLDGKLRAELRHELHLLQRRLRATMIYVTHDQAEAMTLADRVVIMDQGLVQQVAPPLAVYEKPCNRFVAGFLGWPSMNFLDGELRTVAGRLCFVCPAWEPLRLPLDKSNGWIKYGGRAVTLGVRPEHVGLAEDSPVESKCVLELALVEPLGHATLATFRRGEWQLTARLHGKPALGMQGAAVEVCLHMEHAHLFDRATGVALPGCAEHASTRTG